MVFATAGSSSPSSGAATRRTCSSGTPRSSRPSMTATWRRSLPRSTSWESTTTPGASCEQATVTRLRRRSRAEGAEHTEMGWEVYPSGLHELLVRLHKHVRARRPLQDRDRSRARGGARKRERSRSPADFVSRGALRCTRLGDHGRRARTRLLPLVAARQLRMGVRLLAALRDRLCRLRRRSSGCRRTASSGTATSSRRSARPRS